MVLYIGAHLSINKGIINAIDMIKKYGGNALQIFSGSPQSLTPGKVMELPQKDIEHIKEYSETQDVPIFIHAKYLINLSKPLIPKNKIFLIRYVQDLNFATKIGAKGVIVHFGSASNNISREDAKNNMVQSLISCIEHGDKDIHPILETVSGTKNQIGGTIEEINEIYSSIPKKYQKYISFCIDTCHIFVAGYPINKKGGFHNYIKEFEKQIGKNKISAIHLNDSEAPLGSHKDRHAIIGEGYIFNTEMGGSVESLEEIIQYAKQYSVPLLLETHSKFEKQIKYIKQLENKHGGEKKNYTPELIEKFTELMNIHKSLGNIHQFQAYKNIVNKLKKLNIKIDSSTNIHKINIQGFGKKTIDKIKEYIQTNKISSLEKLKSNPKIKALTELQKIYGIGPSIAQKLIKQNIYSINNLLKSSYPLTFQQQMGLKYFNDLNSQIPKKDAINIIKYIQKLLENKTNKNKNLNIELMGGYRLGKNTGKDIDIIISNIDINTIIEILNKYIVAILSKGKNTLIMLMKLPNNIYNKVFHIDIKIAPEISRAFFTLYFGSGENFSRKIRKIAKDKGYKLNEYGIKNLKTNKMIYFSTEKEIFDFLNIPFVSPENRL